MRQLSPLFVAALLVPLGCEPPPEMTVSETKVQILEEQEGRGGRTVGDGDVICIDYRCTDTEGNEILWGQDFCFEVGADVTISGVDEGVRGMRAGGRRIVKCPPHRHWGRPGYAGGKIPPSTTLVIELKLTSIE